MPVNRGFVEHFNDFLAGSATAAENPYHLSIDSGGTSGVVADGTAHGSGRWRLALPATDDSMSEGPNTGLIYQGVDGEAYMETRLIVAAGVVTDLALNVGFSDDPTEGTNTLPVELATTVFTSNASSAAVFVYDVDATNDDWHAFEVAADVDTPTAIADLRFSGSQPTAARWQTFGVRLNDRGPNAGLRAEYSLWDDAYLSGAGGPAQRFFQKARDTNVPRTANLCTYVGAENRAAAVHSVDVDYLYAYISRTDRA